MIIIGGTGTLRAGKGELVEYLRRKGFAHYSVSEFITEEVIRRGLLVNRDTMRNVANDLRANFGAAHIIEVLYVRALEAGEEAIIIESLRSLGEVQRIKEFGGIIIGVDADPLIRFHRALACGSVKDNVTYEEFCAQERAEINEGDPFKQNLSGCLRAADFVLTNNGTLEEFKLQFEAVMKEVEARA